MNSEPGNAQQATYWNEIGGPRWVQQRQHFDRMLLEFGARAMDALHLRTGEHVLDIGCGTGTSSLALAAAVGPSGKVLGCDIAPTMIAAARDRAADSAENDPSAAHVSFLVLDAQTDPFVADRPFDAVFSRFGVMFFSDPVAAFANIAAHVGSDGRLAFACWQGEEGNDWIAVPARILRDFTPNPVVLPRDAPGPFAFSERERVLELLTAAGWIDVRIESFTAPTVMGGGLGLDAAVEHAMQTNVAHIMRQQVDEATLAVATAAVRDALADALFDGAVVYDGNAWIVTANRP